MDPRDLNLPAKFAIWRPHQYDAVVAAACSDKRFTILNAPPGVGKSPAVMGLSQLLGGRTLILTQTKGLQKQYLDDFTAMGLREVKGQNNYPCLYFDDSGHKCDEGPCHAGVECIHKESGCFYYDAVRRAARSYLVVTNNSFWMSINRYAEPGTLGRFDTLVIDEAHDAADALAEFVKIKLSRREVRRLLHIEMPREVTVDEWVAWATDEALPICRERLEQAKTQTHLYKQAVVLVRSLNDLGGHLADLANAKTWKRTDTPDPPAWVPGAATDWIIEEDKDQITFQPTWASGYAEDYLFARVPRILLVSATVTPKDAAYLGIGQEDFEFHQYPSPFLANRRPLYVVPAAKVYKDMMPGEMRLWINRIDQIIEKEKGHKGIIHAISYARARWIKENSRYSGLMVMHDSRSTRKVVDQFRQMHPPAILVSPAVGTGWDFPYEQCRFQIIAKIPFIDNRPAVIKARARSDRHYLNYVALVQLIQMVGRGMRADDDWCRSYLVDDNWRWFQPATKKLMPRWFKSAIRRVRSLSEIPS